MNLVIFLVRRRYVSHRNEQVCHDYIAPQMGCGGGRHPYLERFRSPHKTRLPPCGRLNVR
jgi:hypothetical protein